MALKVWLLNVGEEIPTDPGPPRMLRTGILAHLLADRGHDVTWWNSTVNHQRKEQRSSTSQRIELRPNLRIELVWGRNYASNTSLARMLSHRDNAREFHRIAPALPRPDVIVAGYPTLELAAAAVDFAVARRIPVAVDFRDMWPDIIESHLGPVLARIGAPVFAIWRHRLRRLARDATALIGITDPFLDWALSCSGRPRSPLDKVFHLAIDPKALAAAPASTSRPFWTDDAGLDNSRKVIGCFAGTMSRRLDLTTLLRGAAALPPEVKERLLLVLCGRGEAEGDLQRIAQGEPHIMLAGWRNQAEINTLMQHAHFGILPYRSADDFKASYPNKVGEYLSHGLPIMTGLEGITRDLLRQASIGFEYREGDPESARDCLARIARAPETAAGMRMAALSTFDNMFDPVKIYAKFADFAEELAGSQAVC
jgi:glycosyltransferase involved in cell wall biosynthesis